MTIDGVLGNFKKIEEALSSSSLVKEANENLLKSLTNSSLTHEKRTLLIQQFSEQLALNFINMALDKAMQFDSIVAETNLKNAQKLLVDEQKGLVTNQKATELKKALDIVADTNLKVEQKGLVTNQKATELKKALDIVADTNLKVEQKGLVTNQKATELKKALDIVADTNLKVEQKGLVTNQKATELKKALDIVAETNLKNKQKDLANISIYEKQASASKQLGVNIFSNGWSNQGGGLIDAQILGFRKDMSHKILKSLSEQAGMLAQNDVATPSWMTSEMQSSINYMKS